MQKPCKNHVLCVKRTLVKAIQVGPNICKFLKKRADKVNEASHKKGRDDVVVEFTGIAVNGMSMNAIYKHH